MGCVWHGTAGLGRRGKRHKLLQSIGVVGERDKGGVGRQGHMLGTLQCGSSGMSEKSVCATHYAAHNLSAATQALAVCW